MRVGLPIDNINPHLNLLSQNFLIPITFQEPVAEDASCEQTLRQMF